MKDREGGWWGGVSPGALTVPRVNSEKGVLDFLAGG